MILDTLRRVYLEKKKKHCTRITEFAKTQQNYDVKPSIYMILGVEFYSNTHRIIYLLYHNDFMEIHVRERM